MLKRDGGRKDGRTEGRKGSVVETEGGRERQLGFQSVCPSVRFNRKIEHERLTLDQTRCCCLAQPAGLRTNGDLAHIILSIETEGGRDRLDREGREGGRA